MDSFREWIRKAMAKKFPGYTDPTIGDMRRLKKKRLKIIAVCKERRKAVIVGDDVPISLAVCMSCCVPVFYQPIIHDKYTYLDGGLINNFPLDHGLNKDGGKVLAIRLKRSVEKMVDKANGSVSNYYLGAFDLLWQGAVKNKNLEYGNVYVCKVELNHLVTFLDFNISLLQRQKLFVEGREGAEKFIREKLQ